MSDMMLLLAVLVTALVTAVISVGSTLLIARGRPAVSDRVQESITAFGEELNQLTFDPSAAQATEAAVKDYRLALDAYETAKTAESAKASLAALRDGRAALIRLDARLHGDPVPIEAVPLAAIRSRSADTVSVEATTQRFVSTGTFPGKAGVLIDRPDQRRPILADVAFNSNDLVQVHLAVRTSDRQERLQTLVTASGPYRGRHYLPAVATHVEVESMNGRGQWSVRFKPLGEAVRMRENEHHGEGDEVVAYVGGPAVLTAQVRTDHYWKVEFECASCGMGEPCTCPGRDPDGTLLYGVGGGLQKRQVPGAGWIVVRVDDDAVWSLHTSPR